MICLHPKEVMKQCHLLCACFSTNQLYRNHSQIHFSWGYKWPGLWSFSYEVFHILFQADWARQSARMKNQTTVTSFILLGLTDDLPLKILLFIFLFLSYTLSLSGNLTIITLTLIDSHLKTPMDPFLQNFSFLEISFTTACVPRFLYSISSGDKSITYNDCASQLLFTDLFAGTEFFLLATMSYVAICKPQHYTAIMSNRVCKNFILFRWVAALMITLPPVRLGLGLEFCDSNVVDRFCCDASPEGLLLRHTVDRTDGYSMCSADVHHHPCACSSFLHLHRQGHSKVSLCPAKEEGLLHLLFPHDWGFHYLGQLHLHLCQTLSQGRGSY